MAKHVRGNLSRTVGAADKPAYSLDRALRRPAPL